MDSKTRSFLFILLFLVAVRGNVLDPYYTPSDIESYMEERDPSYAAVCTAKDRCVTTCDLDYQMGCICYNDGTCVEQSVNRCRQCTNPEVFAVFEGQRCPKRKPYVCQFNRRFHKDRFRRFPNRHYRNFDDDRGPGRFCNEERLPSCVCDYDGNCFMKKLNLCNDCPADKYLAIFYNSTCPDKSLYATCNTTESVYPPPTTCNDPFAYLCQEEDRFSRECNLESAPEACVCYTNGTCISGPASACACQREDVISVYTGGYCPTNCTETPLPEEGESEEESAEESTEESSEEGSEEESSEESSEEKSEESSEEESSETMNDLMDQFTPANPHRVFNCDLPKAYICQEKDRNATECNERNVKSCVCNSLGVCISVTTNKCNACSKSEIVSIYEGGYCPKSNCSKTDPRDNKGPNTVIPKNASDSSDDTVSPIIPPKETQDLDNNTTPLTGEDANSTIERTAAVPAQNINATKVE